MANTISSWFTPFWYSTASGESTTLEMINKRREELKTQKKEPSFPKTLTPAKATAGAVGILGLIVAAIGFFKDNSWGKILGIGAAVLAGVGWFIDKLFVKGSSTQTNQQQPPGTQEKPVKPTPEQLDLYNKAEKCCKANGLDVDDELQFGMKHLLEKGANLEILKLYIETVKHYKEKNYSTRKDHLAIDFSDLVKNGATLETLKLCVEVMNCYKEKGWKYVGGAAFAKAVCSKNGQEYIKAYIAKLNRGDFASYDTALSGLHKLVDEQEVPEQTGTITLTITNPHKTQILKLQRPTKENIREEFSSILGNIGNIRVASKNLPARGFYKIGLPEPEYKISVNGSTYFLSEPFLDETMERPAFILYLATTSEDGSQQLFARGLYKSNSQNIWRVASHTTEYMDWLGKGWGQHTTGLPIEIQSSLANIESELGWKYEQKNHLCDALKKIDSRIPPETFMIRHEDKPKRIGQFINPTDPTSFKFDNEADKPNFESGIGQIFKNNNPLYGEITSFIVESHNKELLYLFNLDSEGRAWIGDIQYSYPVLNTYGVKVKPLNIDKKIFTPAYEYGSEIPGGFIGNINPRDSHYYDCSTYTNSIPIIKEFLEKVVAK